MHTCVEHNLEKKSVGLFLFFLKHSYVLVVDAVVFNLISRAADIETHRSRFDKGGFMRNCRS